MIGAGQEPQEKDHKKTYCNYPAADGIISAMAEGAQVDLTSGR